MQEDIRLLKQLMEDMGRQPEEYRFASYWENYVKRIAKEICKSGLAQFRSNFLIGDGFSDTLHTDPFNFKHRSRRNELKSRLGRLLCTMYPIRRFVSRPYQAMVGEFVAAYLKKQSQYFGLRHQHVLACFCEDYPGFDTLVGAPADTFEFRGRTLGKAYLHPIITRGFLSNTKRWSRANTLMEIGGGFGANAHLMLSTCPRLRKMIYLDIPPNLYIGTQYLQHFFGDAVRDYRACAEMDDITFNSDDKLEIYCIAPWQFPKVKSKIDAFFNAHSFQEMSETIVCNYAKEIDRVSSESPCMLLQFYEDTGLEDTLAPEAVVQIFNRGGKFRLSLQGADVGDGEHIYYSE
jgi:putative sugar O-methyltransferase